MYCLFYDNELVAVLFTRENIIGVWDRLSPREKQEYLWLPVPQAISNPDGV